MLSGIKVIDFSKWLPGQYCGMLLGDYGAEVIKVEDLAGDSTRAFFPDKEKGMSYWHLMLNRNKRGVALDIKKEAGKELLLRLLKDADVFLEGFRPGYLARYGLDYESIRKINPRIVYCSITGFGQNSQKPAHDLNVIGLAGLNSLDHEGRGCVSNVQVSAIGSSLNALSGICMALLHRERIGEGQYMDINLFATAMSMQAVGASSIWGCQETGSREFGRIAHYYNIYETKDGRFLTVGTIEPKFWKRFCQLIGCEELISRQYDFEHGQELQEQIGKVVKEKTLSQWLELIGTEEFCVTPVCTLEEALAGELAAPMVKELPSDLGKLRYVANPITFSQVEAKIKARAPKLGEHTIQIMQELGYTCEEIENMKQAGAI